LPRPLLKKGSRLKFFPLFGPSIYFFGKFPIWWILKVIFLGRKMESPNGIFCRHPNGVPAVASPGM